MMRTLVTGGGGYIGGQLVRLLLKQGDHVHILDKDHVDAPPGYESQVTSFVGDIRNRQSVRLAMEGCDRVFHLAAYARNWAHAASFFFEINVGGTEIVMEQALALGVKKVVYVSSNVVFGPSNGHVVTEQSVRESDFYTAYERSKFVSESLVRRYVQKGLNVVIVNPTRVYGPGPLYESNSITKMVIWYLQNKFRFILGDGNAIGNYVFVEDLIRGFVLAMEHGRSGSNYILGGENMSFNHFFDILAKVSRKHCRLFHLPAWLMLLFSSLEKFRAQAFGHHPLITPGWTRTFLDNWEYSSQKAQIELGYSITPFEAGLSRTISWIKDQKGITL